MFWPEVVLHIGILVLIAVAFRLGYLPRRLNPTVPRGVAVWFVLCVVLGNVFLGLYQWMKGLRAYDDALPPPGGLLGKIAFNLGPPSPRVFFLMWIALSIAMYIAMRAIQERWYSRDVNRKSTAQDRVTGDDPDRREPGPPNPD